MTKKEIFNFFKRFFITFLCCVPLFLLISYFLINKIQNWIMILIFIVIAGGTFFVEEIIRQKRLKKKENNNARK